MNLLELRRSIRVAAVLPIPLLVASCASDPISSAIKESFNDPRNRLALYLDVRSPSSAQRMPDGSILARDFPDGINQIYQYRAPWASANASDRKQLTSFPDGVGALSISPDFRRIVVTAAPGGNENSQLYSLSLDGPEPTVTPFASDPRVQFRPGPWVGGSRAMLYSANADSPSDFHIYSHDFTTASTTRLLDKPGSWSPAHATSDGSRILVNEFRSASDSSAFELDTATKSLRPLNNAVAAAAGSPASSTISITAVDYLADESHALAISDAGDGKARLYEINLAAGTARRPLPALDDFELDGADVNHERTLLAVVSNQDGWGVLHLFRLPGYQPVTLPPIEPGVVSISSIRAETVSWTVSNARQPSTTFEWTVGQPHARALTSPNSHFVPLDSFPLPTLVRYPASDSTQIPALLWLPPNHTPGTPIPFIVNYHGGPEGQSRPAFSAFIQYLLDQGFGVMQPNVRGSTGYGRAFHTLDDYKGRWDSVRDGVDAAEWLVEQGFATPGRIATFGGSYGGYMSMACLVEDQARVDAGVRAQPLFGAGVNVVGVINLRSFLELTADYRRKLREAEYGPLSDPDFLDSVSPALRADTLRVPVYIAHGANDPRVPVEEAMSLARTLRAKARDARDPALMPRLFIAPDEGHGFAKLENRLYFYSRMVDFLLATIASPQSTTADDPVPAAPRAAAR